MRIFLDANVLFSAAKSDGAVRQLLSLLRAAGHECWIGDYVLVEAQRNLAAQAPQSLATLELLVAKMPSDPTGVVSVAAEDLQWLPEKDRPVLAAAIRRRCEALVTGDRKHFGTGYGKVFGGVTIHSPRSLAEALLR